MKRKRFEERGGKEEIYDMNRTISMHNIINSTHLQDVSYREIFDSSVDFKYGGPLDEYYENNINAIMVNNIRHNYSNYDRNLKQIYRINRSDTDYEQYKNSVLDRIAKAYPALEKECNKQKRKLNMVKKCKRKQR